MPLDLGHHAARAVPTLRLIRNVLEEQCESDRELRTQVEALLKWDAAAGPEFLRNSSSSVHDELESSGVVAGRYELLEQIGEGGVSVVYLAEQSEPVHRMVAMKIIKPGMDSKQVLARFELERNVLALFNHPHVSPRISQMD
ncbi:MAG: hypothetical protein ACYTHJ_16020 [Planctomycetota bacterium]|jgi:hypothetical protein